MQQSLSSVLMGAHRRGRGCVVGIIAVMHRAAGRSHVSIGVVLGLVVAAFIVVAVAPGASAQTVGDVEARDQLIANQENLLNAYRCLFGVDTEVVLGGCPNPDTVTPGVSPENPSRLDIEVRDGLVQSQEALLNTYRCRFDIDTQIVPGGCIDGVPVVVVRARSDRTDPAPEPAPQLAPLGRPPGGLRLEPFYQKYLDAFGIPIVSSAAVADRAHYQARDLFREVWPTGPTSLRRWPAREPG